jgi:hypothetical protein
LRVSGCNNMTSTPDSQSAAILNESSYYFGFVTKSEQPP